MANETMKALLISPCSGRSDLSVVIPKFARLACRAVAASFLMPVATSDGVLVQVRVPSKKR